MFNSGKYNYTEIQTASLFNENANAAAIDRDNATIRILEDNILAISYPIRMHSHIWIVTILQ